MEDKEITILMDTFYTGGLDSTDLELHFDRGRLAFFISDNSDYVQGYFRSVEDIEVVIKELQSYIDEVKK